MDYIGTWYDSVVYRHRGMCVKHYSTSYRTLSPDILSKYHKIQTSVADRVNGNIKWNVWDEYCGLAFFDLDVEVLPLPQESITFWLNSCLNKYPISKIPYITWKPLSEILYGRFIVELIINKSTLSNSLKAYMLIWLDPWNVKFQEKWDKRGTLIITDLASCIVKYVTDVEDCIISREKRDSNKIYL